MYTTSDVESNWSWSQTETSNCQLKLFWSFISSHSELEWIKETTILIANSEHFVKLEACKTVSVCLVRRVQAWSLVVGGCLALVFLIPRVGLLEEGLAVSGSRVKTEREELQCQVEDDTAKGLVVRIMKVLFFTSLGQCEDRLTVRVCTFRVIDRGKNEAPSRMEASLDG